MKSVNTGTEFREEVDYSLTIDPKHEPTPWQVFRVVAPRFSGAFDGYVLGGAREDYSKPVIARDHHLNVEFGREDEQVVNRLSMRSTMGQIFMDIRSGLYLVFRNEHGPIMRAFFKSCDEDDCFTNTMLKEPQLVFNDTRSRLEGLVDLADKMDTTAGLYKTNPNSNLYRSLIWVTDPYREFRHNGGLHKNDPAEYRDIMDQVGKRIKRYINGTHRRLSPDTSYEKLGGGKGWVMIEETGKQGRQGAINDGHKAIVSVCNLPNGNYAYVFTRLSTYVHYFNLPFFIQTLNEYEMRQGNTSHLWGGSGDLVMGSPFEVGTDIDPMDMETIVNEMMHQTVSDRLISTPPPWQKQRGGDQNRLQNCH